MMRGTIRTADAGMACWLAELRAVRPQSRRWRGGQRRGHSTATLPHTLQQKLTDTLSPAELALLQSALHPSVSLAASAAIETPPSVPRPTGLQLRRYFLQGMLPMIGFGFVDNAIMLTAGDAIDQTLGATLQISTLAAAGLGNMVSDVMGLGLSSYVEAFASKVGIPSPQMSVQQMELPVARWTMLAASAVGITIGCLLGMAPLLFLTTDVTTAEHIFKTLDHDSSGRCTLEEIQPFLQHLGLDANNPAQITKVLGVEASTLEDGITRAQFDTIWHKMEATKHDGLRSLAQSLVEKRGD
eukprot:m.14843 g.14843  ORF g.14843 m.14843 type:complete len:299 (+) comp4833_c0_seq1:312-1208(+)